MPRYVKTKKQTLKFDGKEFELIDVNTDKRAARNAAKQHRKQGLHVRIVRRIVYTGNKAVRAYAIFVRRKK